MQLFERRQSRFRLTSSQTFSGVLFIARSCRTQMLCGNGGRARFRKSTRPRFGLGSASVRSTLTCQSRVGEVAGKGNSDNLMLCTNADECLRSPLTGARMAGSCQRGRCLGWMDGIDQRPCPRERSDRMGWCLAADHEGSKLRAFPKMSGIHCMPASRQFLDAISPLAFQNAQNGRVFQLFTTSANDLPSIGCRPRWIPDCQADEVR
jgi:hypothetical protein